MEVPFAVTNLVATNINGATAVDLGDIDGDQDLDMVVAVSLDGVLLWYENTDGAGASFSVHSIDAGFAGAIWVEVLDMDRDGDLDVLGAAGTADDVAWFENSDGMGTSWSRHNIEVNYDSARVVIGTDVDRDGDIDVACAGFREDAITWWANGGDGTTWTPVEVTTNLVEANGVSAGDIDGDGDVDFAGSGEFSKTIAWYRNDDSIGTAWTEYLVDTNYADARSAKLYDLDQDGDLDILAVSQADDEVAWYENTAGDGTAWTKRLLDIALDRPYEFVVADLDHDGDPDVAATGQTDDELAWYENLAGASNWQTRTVNGNIQAPRGVAAQDLDGDGDADLAVVSYQDDFLQWYDNRSLHRGFFFEEPRGISKNIISGQALEFCELNNDGWLDIASGGGTPAPLQFLLNPGATATGWIASAAGVITSEIADVISADLDLDGNIDVATVSSAGRRLDLWYGDGAGGIASSSLMDTGAVFISIDQGDVDGNGRPDLLVSPNNQFNLLWYRNTQTGFVKETISPLIQGSRAGKLVDVDRDGDLDAVALSAISKQIVLFENQATGQTWQAHVIAVTTNNPSFFSCFDADGDGDQDIMLPGPGSDTFNWYENPGGGSNWTAHPLGSQAVNSWVGSGGDLDHDGDQDVLAVQRNLPGLYTYANNGTGVFDQVLADIKVTNVQDVGIADLNRDGSSDLVLLNTDGLMSWYPNQGGSIVVASTGMLAGTIDQGIETNVMVMDVTHLGRMGDSEIQLLSLPVLLQEMPGDPLLQSELEDLLEFIRIYKDDGSGMFEAGSDLLVTNTASFPVGGNGILNFQFGTEHPDMTVALANPARYFIVSQFKLDAVNRDPDTVYITPLLETWEGALPSAQDVDYGVSAVVESRSNRTAWIQPIAGVDVAIFKEPLPAVVEVGTQMMWVITVTNQSLFKAIDVEVVDVLPTQMTYQVDGSFTLCTNVSETLYCGIGDLLSAAAIEFTVRVYSAGTAVQTITNTAQILTNSGDSNELNNAASGEVYFPDLDGDNLADNIDADDDGDMMLDAWELTYGLDPTNPADATEDPDLDGYENLSEFITETVPTNGADYFLIDQVLSNYPPMHVQLNDSATGSLYSLQYLFNLQNPQWIDVPGMTDLNGINAFTPFNDAETTNAWRIYRIRVRLD